MSEVCPDIHSIAGSSSRAKTAVATPPDVVSQVSLAIPLYGLYELGIVLAIFAEKKARQKEQQAA